jgi:hypothetical protein
MLKSELKATGIPYRDKAGRQFDFQALRHQFVSNLAAAGIHARTAQELAQRCDIKLPMNADTHLQFRDVADALNTLPSLPKPKRPEVPTGTQAIEHH